MAEEVHRSDFADDPEMREIIQDFVAGLGETIGRLEAMVATGNLVEIRRIGHQMKGAGGGYGFRALSAAGYELEKSADGAEEVNDFVRQAVARFIDAVSRVRTVVPTT